MTTSKRIVVTGATGQLGRLVVADLLKIAPTAHVIGIVRNAAARFRPGRNTMTIRRTTALAAAAGALCLTFGLCAAAQEAPWYNGVTVFEHAIPSTAGKSMVAVVVNYPPGGKSPAHHHAPSAFIYAHVLSGAIRSQVNDEPAEVYQVGEGFYEMPGAHHRISENASDTDPASLLAVFVVDSNDSPLTTPDQKEGSR